MLAPEIIDMFAGHLLLHAKLRMLQPGRLHREDREGRGMISMAWPIFELGLTFPRP
jgi:hypothetical protein